jgi:NAD(P)-dependent dehydrogenase (short-subunit alcohol dehydrogenase family)
MRLADKVLVIIGGTAGMGFSAAQACVREGAKVVIVGRKESNLKEASAALGEASIGVCGDAQDPTVAERAIAKAVAEFRGFHGLYHVAGGSGRKLGDGPLHEITNEGWNGTFDLNLSGLFYSNRAAAQQFLKQGGGGSILNISSILGLSPSPHYFATHAYAAAKSAVFGLTRACAAYYAKESIRFNALVPALVETPMSQRAMENTEIMQFIKTKQPLDGGRAGHPSDLDAAAVFFLSDESRFVTGQTLAIDGGWSVTEGQVP